MTEQNPSIEKIQSEILRIDNDIFNIVNLPSEIESVKWNYKMVDNASEHELSELGQKGWELVGIATYEIGGGLTLDGLGVSRYKVQIRYAFKRKIVKHNRDNEVDALKEQVNILQLRLIDEKAKVIPKTFSFT